MTLGEYRVGITFNPSNNDNVNKLKRLAADFIDLCADIRASQTEKSNLADPEFYRLWALAQTHIEDAAMWAVKAATKTQLTNG